jgi:hypothetical protein
MKKYLGITAMMLAIIFLSGCGQTQSPAQNPAQSPSQTEQKQAIETSSTVQNTPEENIIKSSKIIEQNIEIIVPSGYVSVKNDELNRRGSFASYNLSKNHSYPELLEVGFFTKESVQKFEQSCVGVELCFEGFYPTVKRLNEEKVAFDQTKNLGTEVIKYFNGRVFLVGNEKVSGDMGFVRSYITYINDIRIQVWIYMLSEKESAIADNMFKEVKFVEKQ